MYLNVQYSDIMHINVQYMVVLDINIQYSSIMYINVQNIAVMYRAALQYTWVRYRECAWVRWTQESAPGWIPAVSACSAARLGSDGFSWNIHC